MSVWRAGTWTLRQRVLALCLLVGVVLTGLAVFAGAAAVTSNRQMDDVLNRIGPMRVAGERLVTAVVDQETGIRGYALSGDRVNLSPYTSGVQQQKEQLALIENSLHEGRRDEAVRADLRIVEARIAAWQSAVAQPVIAAGGAHDSVNAASTAQFNAVRTSVSLMQNDIQSLRDQAATDAKDASRTMVVIQIAAAAVIILAGAFLLVLLDRLITRPVVELAGRVREVAAGDYERHLFSNGSPELAKLAEDVDGMRQKIASELSEVREARGQVEWINAQLKIQAEELTRSNRDLEQFAYVASHDLQEPLRKVASFCQLLQRRYAGKLDDRADQYIGFAVDGAARMQRLINDLLAFSRIGRLTTGFTDVDLDRVLTDVAAQVELPSEDAEVSWSGLPAVEGEEPLLTTLFVNLVTNSLKFRRPGVPPVVRISAERSGELWQITVRDNGIGIEAEFADKVFVIFQRLHPRDAYEGTGIGLAIVKKIVEYHGGRIWLDLDVPEGTSINFTLPAAPEQAAPEENGGART